MSLPNIDALAKDILAYDMDTVAETNWLRQPSIFQRNKVDVIHDVNVTIDFTIDELVNRFGLHNAMKSLTSKSMKTQILKVVLEEVSYLYYTSGDTFDVSLLIRTMRASIRARYAEECLKLFLNSNPHALSEVEELTSIRKQVAHSNGLANDYASLMERAEHVGIGHASREFRERIEKGTISRVESMIEEGIIKGGLLVSQNGMSGLNDVTAFTEKGEGMSEDITNGMLDNHFLPKDHDVRAMTDGEQSELDRRLGLQARGKRTKIASRKRREELMANAEKARNANTSNGNLNYKI